MGGAGVSGGPGGISAGEMNCATGMEGEGCCVRRPIWIVTGGVVASVSNDVSSAVMSTGTVSLCRAT